MALYVYEGINAEGIRKKGTIRAHSQLDARDQVKKKQVKPFYINVQTETAANREIKFFNKVSTKLLVAYLQQFAILISAGVTVLEGSQMLVDQEKNKNLKASLIKVSDAIQSGRALSEVYQEMPEVFPTMLTAVIQASETAGTLESTLKQMASYYERVQKSKSSLRTAMIYPLMMILFALGVGVFMLVSIVPMFVSMFEDLGATLPFITKVCLKLSQFLTSKGLVFLAVLIMIGIVLQVIKSRSKSIRRWLDALKLKMPILGELNLKGELSIGLSTMSSLLASSVPIVETLEMSQKAVTNLIIKDLFNRGRITIEEGGKLSQVFASQLVPNMTSSMIIVGENTGQLDAMLVKLAAIYEDEVSELTERLKTVLEPLIIVFICIIVGIIVMAIMLPMFSMFGAVQG
ncbi:type II secretion system F family protein [Lactococcus carnosus]|uniref:type II secretion system F family protein n=1 Tax=Pseudolactococcus carnosus TaxID=2749961 RepID=UPI001FB9E20B|nr:type II secretion system F family protein [Lactococcus carnosus]MCJ2002632.1 type II secretion system F family protein [Lactococcus carnosus]